MSDPWNALSAMIWIPSGISNAPLQLDEIIVVPESLVLKQEIGGAAIDSNEAHISAVKV